VETKIQSYTGSRKWTNYELESEIIPVWGEKHNINFRVLGGLGSYAAGLLAGNRISLYKNVNGNYTELAGANFDWETGKSYRIKVRAFENHFTIFVNDKELIGFTDDKDPYLRGQAGFSNIGGGHTHFRYLKVKAL
jgi:hypothetical protein